METHSYLRSPDRRRLSCANLDIANPYSSDLPGRTWERLALYLSIYALTVLLTSLLWERPATLTLAYALTSALLLWRWHSRSEMFYFGLSALLGPAGEFIAVGYGAWQYSLPWVNIPIWLPLAYGITGLFLYKIVGLFLQIQLRRSPRP